MKRKMALVAVTLCGAAVLVSAMGGTEATASTRSAADGLFSVDNVHSTVLFRVSHLGVSQSYGRFNEIDGGFLINPDSPESSSINITVKTTSVDTANGKRDDHLRSPDFFNAAQFPVTSFKSTAFKKVGDKRYEVTGDLTLHGVTKSITVPLEHVGTAETQRGVKAGFECMFDIKRADYGMNYMPGALGDDVRIIVSIEGDKK